ncbi:protein CREG2 [Scleropages formosus]|uniref:protein CREG2 n=1 Tax=Scleropages formosus TaxID=113540 RepID=UPI0010FA6455|nr:protein CREG2 [Scleropages formosus]
MPLRSTMCSDARAGSVQWNVLLSAASVLSVLCRSGEGYAVRNHAVSWAATSEAEAEERELHGSSGEEREAASALLGGTGGMWRQAYPAASIYSEDADRRSAPLLDAEHLERVSSPSTVFTYRMEGLKAGGGVPTPPVGGEAARAARDAAHRSDWGFLCALPPQEQIKGVPFGNIFSLSDGPQGNSTGIPYFYVTARDYTVSSLRRSPAASLSFPEVGGDFCRKSVYKPEESRCVRLTLVGRMVEVDPEEVPFAEETVFSRHPVMKKWPVEHGWFFMKLIVDQVWLQDWVGGLSRVPLEEYLKANPY